MTQTAHTQGPWRTSPDTRGLIYGGKNSNAIAATDGECYAIIKSKAIQYANAARIVACVNACEGTPTERLYHGSYGVHEYQADTLRAANAELVAALREMLRLESDATVTARDVARINDECRAALAKFGERDARAAIAKHGGAS